MTTIRLLKHFPWIPVLLVLVAGSVYLLTLDTGLRPDELTGGDLITHQYAQVQGRPSNAPGYPLYTMLGWLWFRVGRAALGWLLNPVQILSFYSTIWGLAALWTLCHLLLRPEVSQGDHLWAGLLSLFYAFTYFFWYYSVTTEQYTSAIFQTLLLVWLVFEWEARPDDRTLLLMALVSGTMLANMLTTLFIVPPLFYLVLTRRPEIVKNLRLVGGAIALGLLPALSYLYVYLRGAQHPEWRGEGNWSSSGEWFWQFISTRQGRDELALGLTWQHLITPEYPSLIWGELTWAVLLGGLFGWLLLGRRKGIFFFASLGIYLFFVTVYRFGNWFQVILPLYPLLILGFGRTLTWLRLRFREPWFYVALTAALLVLVGTRFRLSYPRADQSYLPTDTGLAPGWAVLADVAAPGWSISPAFEEWVALQYLTEVWGAEPVIHLQPPGAPAEFITRQAALAFPGLIDPQTDHPQAVGATLIWRQGHPAWDWPPFAQPTPLEVDLGGGLRLLGYQVARAGRLVTLYWRAAAALEADYTVSVRLWQGGGPIQGSDGPLIQDHRPVWNTYPTNLWQPGELVADAYTFELPAGLHPEQIHIVVYRPLEAGFENIGDLLIDLQ